MPSLFSIEGFSVLGYIIADHFLGRLSGSIGPLTLARLNSQPPSPFISPSITVKEKLNLRCYLGRVEPIPTGPFLF